MRSGTKVCKSCRSRQELSNECGAETSLEGLCWIAGETGCKESQCEGSTQEKIYARVVSCRSVDSCAVFHQESSENVFNTLLSFIHIFLFSFVLCTIFSFFMYVPFFNINFRMPKDPSFQRVFPCKKRRRYSRERASQSLPKIRQKFEKKVRNI